MSSLVWGFYVYQQRYWSIGAPSRFKPRNGACKVSCGEGREIVDAFADANEVHGQWVFGGDGDKDAAACGAVEFRHDEPGHAGDLGELLNLRQCVLPDRGIEHKQNGMRRRGIDFFHHAYDFLKLTHQL